MGPAPLQDSIYLSKLQDYYARHRVFPSYAAIAAIVGLKSTSSVSALLKRLTKEGYLESKERRLRPGVRFFDRPKVLGSVSAGLPAIGFDAPPDGLAIDAHLIRQPSQTFLLTVKGDSMVNAGLLQGDMLVVERAPVADEGNIVVAIVEGAYTVKRLVRENGKFVLKPENDGYSVLRPDPLELIGIVVGSFRKYR